MDERRDRWNEILGSAVPAKHWRAPSELLDDPAFRAALANEFPDGATEPDESFTRRGFLQLLGASVALATANGCSRAPEQPILPYTRQPPEVTPGVPNEYATTMVLDGYGTGLVVESHEGRPTKIEGNADHPASLGAAGLIEQAWVLELYDPSRARAIRHGDEPATWQSVVDEFAPRADTPTNGAGLHIVLEPTSSPTRIGLIEAVRARWPQTQFHYHAPVGMQNTWDGTRMAFGRVLEPQYDLRAAQVVVSLDADVLNAGPGALRRARQFADGRRLESAASPMNRLYVVESMFTSTGVAADHRLPLRRADVAHVARALCGVLLPSADPTLSNAMAQLPERAQRFVRAMAADLGAHRGACLVTVGESQPAAVHALVHRLNGALGNVGRTISFTDPVIFEAGLPSHDLRPLRDALSAGAVDTLWILGPNPVYSAPADLALGTIVRRARRRLYLGLYENETAACCQWMVPSAHGLECWGDARAVDGTLSIAQPLVSPLYGGKSVDEMLALLLGRADATSHTLVRERWNASVTTDADREWERAVRDGVVANTAFASVATMLTPTPSAEELAPIAPLSGTEIAFVPDARVYDGRFTNNAWLLECPEPLTRLTWDNAAIISPALAAQMGLSSEDVVELRHEGRSLRAPVWVLPGHADGTVTLHLGFGRRGSEALARDVGVNAYAMRSSDAMWSATGATIRRVEGHHVLASIQTHWAMEGRPIVLDKTRDEYARHPDFASERNRRALTLYQLAPNAPHQWAMAIDLTVCTGCSACVIACQAENNIPVVGKLGVLKNREMHWLRIDRYFDGPATDPVALVQPMLCQHCEKAPCEYVCPVGATTHSADGLNEMVYNRCVGTRFCSNNCPYKVRRFNYLNYNFRRAPTEQLVMNPDVTVRSRGVMEKCTYCVQRIRETEIRARAAQRPIEDGEIQTACQQTCPTHAITFGSLTDGSSRVARLHRNERTYAVLNDLGTEPRTRYLARIRNVNPALGENA